MDITQTAIALRKEIEKIDIKLSDSLAFSHQKIAELKNKCAALLVQLKAVLGQL